MAQRKLQCLLQGVDEPAKYQLARVERAIAQSQFLVRNGSNGTWQVIWGLEDLVNGVYQDVSDYFPTVGATLYSEDEVINKDAGIGKWLWQRLVGSYAEAFHTFVAKGLFLCKRARPNTETVISALCTRVKEPTQDDWCKLLRYMRYLNATHGNELIYPLMTSTS